MGNISTGGIERLYEELAKNTRLTYQKLCELLALNNTPKVGVDYEGNPTSVSNSILTVPHPESVQLVKFCGTSTEYDKTILCEPITGTKVVIVTAYSQTGVPSSIPYNLLTSTIYSGDISKLEYCNEEIESDPITMCDGGVSFLRWVIKRNGIPTGKLDTLLDGFSPYTTTSTTQSLGDCLAVSINTIHSEINVTNGIYNISNAVNSVRITYDSTILTVNVLNPLTIRIIGNNIEGNGLFIIHPNNQEFINFKTEIITGVEVIDSIGNCVTIEFFNKYN